VDDGWEMVAVGAVPRRSAVASLRRQLRCRLAPSRRLAGTPGFDPEGKTRGSDQGRGRGVWGKGQAGPVFFPGQPKTNIHSTSHLD
jgi:hypothetical protein